MGREGAGEREREREREARSCRTRLRLLTEPVRATSNGVCAHPSIDAICTAGCRVLRIAA